MTILSRKVSLNKTGFTLLETLVSIAIFSIIFVAIVSTIWLGLRLTSRSREIAQKYLGARVVLDSMAMELRSAFDFRFPGYDNFKWDPQEKKLEFWLVASDETKYFYPRPAPVYRVIYNVREEEGRKILYKKTAPVYPGNFNVMEGPVLYGDFDFAIEYPTPRQQETLPEKIVITFKPEKGDVLQRTVYLPIYKKF
ncbi:MAG: prepilin-type N-terminal cleavage/methylation domain-containing protein [Candidatus Omnitrophica bacterium]|nr:prepilin-type N-terminal cleavage/methylation domain-containing protein [Candidatus Omnitrophota bacterium]MCM8793518.1 prepilin-type N-terminal cleavage/methylation domain-containing protein [Candidatus Omnitrophota bacterium]